MWLVSCRRQGILTQGPVTDPKCKLNISLFLNSLDCLICTKNSLSMVLLLWMMGDVIDGGGWSISGCEWRDRDGYYLIVFWLALLSFVFPSPFSCFLSEWSLIAVVSVSLFIICFVCLLSRNYQLLGHKKCCICHVKLFIKSVYYFSWLICDPCSFYFHAVCQLFGSANFLLLMALGKTRNLPQILRGSCF